ncbi:MAG: DUF445 family protein [Opitutales bacterium]
MTAFIGWLTNWVAIRMLFRPHRPLSLFGYTWQGMIPKRQKDLAANAAAIVEKEILGKHLLREQIEKLDLKPYMKELGRRLVHGGLMDKLHAVPFIGGFINQSILEKIEGILLQEIEKQSEPLKKKLADEMEERVPIRQLVEERIAALDVVRLEDVVNRVARKEFRAIEILGAVLGFAVGLIQLLLLLLTGSIEL